jgi:hypothetical protein
MRSGDFQDTLLVLEKTANGLDRDAPGSSQFPRRVVLLGHILVEIKDTAICRCLFRHVLLRRRTFWLPVAKSGRRAKFRDGARGLFILQPNQKVVLLTRANLLAFSYLPRKPLREGRHTHDLRTWWFICPVRRWIKARERLAVKADVCRMNVERSDRTAAIAEPRPKQGTHECERRVNHKGILRRPPGVGRMLRLAGTYLAL